MKMGDNTSGQEKVVFPFDEGAETMWCDPLGDSHYKLDNIPLFSYGINLHDIFLAKRVGDDSRPYFDKVLERSGNRTCRVTILEGHPSDTRSTIELSIAELRHLADGVETYGPDYYCLNIPPTVNFEKIEAALVSGEEKGFWEWELSSDY